MKQRFSTNNSTEPMEFGEIDFEEIEWRSEYSYLPDVFGGGLLVHILFRWVTHFGQPKWLPYLITSLPIILFLTFRLFKHNSKLVLTGHSVLLKRPRLPFGIQVPGLDWLLSDIEIPYVQLDEIESREDLFLDKYQLTGIAKRKVVAITIYSHDHFKQIEVSDKLKDFPAFVEELKRRRQAALLRYQGYAKGTSLRQPGRSVEIQSAQQKQKVERLLEEKASIERLQQRLKS